MAATSVLINVGAATAGAVSELAKVDTALNGNKTAVEKASAAVKTETKQMSASVAAMAASVKADSAKANTALTGVGDGADTLASKGAQAAGALAGIGQVVGGPFGASLVAAGTAMQFAADAGDLLNVAVEGGRKLMAVAGTALGNFAKATRLQAAATKVAAGVQAAFNVVMAANPIVLVVLAVIALIAVVVLLWKNWDKVTKLISKAWDFLKNVLRTGIEAIIGFFKALPGKLLNALSGLGSLLVGKGKELLTGFVTGYLSIYVKIFEFFGGLAGKIGRAIGGLGKALYGKGKELIQGFINGIKSMAGRILDAILSILPGPVRGIIRGALGFSLAPGTGSRIGTYGARNGGGNSAIINLYGSASSADARVIKRALEGYDITQGRRSGTPLRVSW